MITQITVAIVLFTIWMYHLIKLSFSHYYLNEAKKREGEKDFEQLVLFFESLKMERMKNNTFFGNLFLIYIITLIILKTWQIFIS